MDSNRKQLLNSVRFQKRKRLAKTPTKATPGSIGFDLFSISDTVILPGKTTKINTGIALDLTRSNTYARIASRSGLALRGIIAVGGVIDPDYTSEIAVILFNTTDEPYQVKSGHRIAQLIFERAATDVVLEETSYESRDGEGDVSTEPTPGHGGFGSTGL